MLELLMHEAKMLKRQGKKIEEIAQAIGKSPRTVHYYLSNETKSRKKRLYDSKLDPFKPYIDTILSDDLNFNRIVLFEKIKRQGYDGGITILRDYALEKSNELNQKAVIRFETEPGLQAQVDWKILNKQNVDEKDQKLYSFEMVLGFSRAPFVIHTTNMDQSTFNACHVLAFEYFGGVPSEILYDNMKTAFIYSQEDEKWKPNKNLLMMASHYGFLPKRCQVRRPQTKGKVERFIHYYENNFWIEHKNKPLELDQLNEDVLSWIAKINGKTISGLNESRTERFDHEKKYLIPLPLNQYDYRKRESVKVSSESMIRVNCNWYSVPVEYLGKTLTACIDPMTNQVEIIYETTVIKTLQLDFENKNKRYWEKSHREAMEALWRKQWAPLKDTRRKKIPKVITRTPMQYEDIFRNQEDVL